MPPHSPSVERVPVSLRVTPAMKKRLDEAAAISGRSISQEAELRLEFGFDREEFLQEIVAVVMAGESVAIALKDINPREYYRGDVLRDLVKKIHADAQT